MTLPDTVGVVGGGRMGSGIVHAFLIHGVNVTLVEQDPEAARGAYGRVLADVGRTAERSKIPIDVTGMMARLTVGDDIDALTGHDLIVEAVAEDVELKSRLLGRAAEIAPDAVLASNTSSLSITALAKELSGPERFIGLHFFNPVPASTLIEIVVGERTAPELVLLAGEWVEALNKTAITVSDSPGFASSRLGVAIALEAMRMLQEGVATAGDIDTAMTQGYRHPTGPLRTTDLVGLDVRLAIAQHLERELGERFAPPAILIDKVAAGELGRKSGQGFFTW